MIQKISGFVVLIMLSSSLAAQVDRASLTGTITDSTEAVIGGARIEVVSSSTGFQRQTTSTDAGTFQLSGLPIGIYKVTVEKPGFRTMTIDNVVLSVGQERTIDAQLQIGGITAEVEVSTALEPLNRSSAEVGAVIDSNQIRDVPLNGRSFATLMMMAPGAINAGGGTERDIRFNGRSRDDNNFTFDGIDASGIQEQPQKAEAHLQIPLESIAEFRVNTAVYTAESGSAGGGQVNVVSRSGTNQFHGSAFEFLRNDAFDSRSPFDGSAIPPFHMNQFGASFGGPLAKNRAFFFGNYEGIRQHLGTTLLGNVPSASVRSQVLSTSPALAPIVNAFPAGQTHLDANTDLYTLQTVNTLREDAGMARFDYLFSNNTSGLIRYS